MTRHRPLFLQLDGPNASDLGHFVAALFGQADTLLDLPVGAFDLTESAPAAMTVEVSPGAAIIVGDTVPSSEGAYFVYADAAESVTIAPSDPTNPRIDLIVARVENDDVDANGSNGWVLEAVAGTAAPSPAAPALPASAIELGEVTVPAGATTITSGDLSVPVPSSWKVPSNVEIGGDAPEVRLAADGSVVEHRLRQVGDVLRVEVLDDASWVSVFEVNGFVPKFPTTAEGVHLSADYLRVRTGANTPMLIEGFVDGEWVPMLKNLDSGAGSNVEIGAQAWRFRDGDALANDPSLYRRSTLGNLEKILDVEDVSSRVRLIGAAGANALLWLGTTTIQSRELTSLVDGGYSLGGPGGRWADVWAVNAAIQTSDERMKTKDGTALGLDFIEAVVAAGGVFAGRWRENIVEITEPAPVEWEDEDGTVLVAPSDDEPEVTVGEGSRTHQFLGAQTVAQVLEDMGEDPADHAIWLLTPDEDGNLDPDARQALREGEMIPVLMSAVADLAAELREMKATMADHAIDLE